jgi:hypothetical protein
MKTPKKLHMDYEAVPELDTPRYLAGDVAAAAEVAPGTLKAWLTREPRVVPLGPYDQKARGKGTPRLFTLRRVYAIAMTSELISLGLMPSRAGVLSFLFTDMHAEDADKLIGSKLLAENAGPLFFVAHPGQDAFKIMPSAKFHIADLMEGIAPDDEPSISVAVIDCAALMKKVRTRLKERGA